MLRSPGVAQLFQGCNRWLISFPAFRLRGQTEPHSEPCPPKMQDFVTRPSGVPAQFFLCPAGTAGRPKVNFNCG